MKIKFTESKKGQIQDIQRKFRKYFSQDEIEKMTSQTINGVMGRSISILNKEVKKNYNITPKYLKRTATVFPKAKPKNLDSGITLSTSRIPLSGFKPKVSNSSISVTIEKGKTHFFRHAYMATVAAGNKGETHTGVWENKLDANGKKIRSKNYNAKKKNYKYKMKELKTASPWAMGMNHTVAEKVMEYMNTQTLKAVNGRLQGAVDKVIGKK